MVSILDFTGAAYTVAMLSEILNPSPGGAQRRHVTIDPGARNPDHQSSGERRPGTCIHVGDWSGTLIGPWLETAFARSLTGQEIDCRFPGAGSVSTAAPELLIVSAHGALAHDRPDRLGEVRFGIETFGLQEASSAAFDVPRVALLGACEVGRSHTRADELHGSSLPSMLLHRGADLVAAPLSPVDDLSSAILVTQTLLRFQTMDATAAVLSALDDLRTWSTSDVELWTRTLVETFIASPVADCAPWPRHLVRAHCERWLARSGDQLSGRLRPYMVAMW